MAPLLTPKEVCELLQIARATLYRWVGENKIPYTKLPNGKLRFRSDRLEAWIDKKSFKPLPGGDRQ